MGSYLGQKFTDEYYSIGFGFNSGEFRAYNNDLKKYMICTVPDVSVTNSSDYVFNQCAVPDFIIDFKKAGDNGLINDFLNQKLYSRAIGGDYSPDKQAKGRGGTFQKLIKMYNAIIFIKNTTAVSPL
jgi:erythromycin esterase-like protein